MTKITVNDFKRFMAEKRLAGPCPDCGPSDWTPLEGLRGNDDGIMTPILLPVGAVTNVKAYVLCCDHCGHMKSYLGLAVDSWKQGG